MFVKSLFAFAVLAPSALAAISISAPSSDAYWVQFSENRISWSYTEGDPNPVSIVITHADSNILNGEFSIEEYVPVSQESLTVTNVTLKASTGYVVNFVNTTDHTQVYAQSSQFEVKAPGTPPYGQTVISTVIPITTTISGSAFVTSTTLIATATSGVALSSEANASSTGSASASASVSTGASNNNGAIAMSGSAGMWTGVVALGTAFVAGFLV